MSKLSSKLFNLSDKILEFVQRFENIPNKYPEIIVLILFPILIALFGYFHEPWFDEAQAWQIAKCASYKEIILYLPHFEGHPPLWHLILSIFAKNGFPYEITLKTIAFVFSYLGAILVLFKSPFYRLIRVLLPFSYFLFYDSTIISRPYCMIMLAFSLLALCYYQKNEKPFLYALGLIFLSLTHTYSFVIASFMTLVWFIEVIEKIIKDKIKFKKLLIVFFLLLIFYLALAYILVPSPDSLAINTSHASGILRRLTYTFFIILPDCFISYICNFMPYDSYTYLTLALGSFVGLIIWFFMYYFTKGKKYIFLTFLIPYIPFAIIATKYFAIPHISIPFCFVIFICWITVCNSNKIPYNDAIKKCFILFVSISIFVGMYWNFKSCILDVFVPFAKGKKEAEFIKEYHLDNYKIMVEWDDNSEKPNPNLHKTWQTVAPYFEKNIFYNFNEGDSKRNYVLGKESTQEENKKTYAYWKKQGLPDVIAGEINLNKIYKSAKTNDYITVFSNNTNYIRKGTLLEEQIITINVRKDLAEKLGIKQVTPVYKSYKVDLYSVTSYLVAKVLVWNDERKEKLKQNTKKDASR